jgi:hypothetical protein
MAELSEHHQRARLLRAHIFNTLPRAETIESEVITQLGHDKNQTLADLYANCREHGYGGWCATFAWALFLQYQECGYPCVVVHFGTLPEMRHTAVLVRVETGSGPKWLLQDPYFNCELTQADGAIVDYREAAGLIRRGVPMAVEQGEINKVHVRQEGVYKGRNNFFTNFPMLTPLRKEGRNHFSLQEFSTARFHEQHGYEYTALRNWDPNHPYIYTAHWPLWIYACPVSIHAPTGTPTGWNGGGSNDPWPLIERLEPSVSAIKEANNPPPTLSPAQKAARELLEKYAYQPASKEDSLGRGIGGLVGENEKNRLPTELSIWPVIGEGLFEWLTLMHAVDTAKEAFAMVDGFAGIGHFPLSAANFCKKKGIPAATFSLECDAVLFTSMNEIAAQSGITDPLHMRFIGMPETGMGPQLYHFLGPYDWRRTYDQVFIPQEDAKGKVAGDYDMSAFAGTSYLAALNKQPSRYNEMHDGRIVAALPQIDLAPIIMRFPVCDYVRLDFSGCAFDFKIIQKALNEKTRWLMLRLNRHDTRNNFREVLGAMGWTNVFEASPREYRATAWGDILFTKGISIWANPRFVSETDIPDYLRPCA